MKISSAERASILKAVAGLSVIGLTACANVHDFPMNESYQQVRNVQILDPEASERNDGVVLSLEGNYGRRVMLKYRESNEAPIEAKEIGASIITD